MTCVVLLLQGSFPGADASKVSSRAKARGASQCGTLGSGNHYVEVQVSTAWSGLQLSTVFVGGWSVSSLKAKADSGVGQRLRLGCLQGGAPCSTLERY